MKKFPHIFLLLATVSSSFLLLTACQKTDTPATFSQISPEQKKLSIVASFYPLAEFASQVGGEAVEVSNIIAPGAEPHDYEPTPLDIAKINTAAVFIYNGAGFEAWGDGVKTNLNKKDQTIIEITQHVELISNDPHIWLDPANAQKEVAAIRNALIKADPNNASVYTQNSARYLEKLAALDQKIAKGLQDCRSRDMVISHDAFSYFAKRYNLNQIPIAGLSPEAEPSAKELAKISRKAKTSGTQYIFYETLVSPKIAKTLAREIDAKTLVLNTLESLSAEEIKAGKDYISVMEENLQNLRTGLHCQ